MIRRRPGGAGNGMPGSASIREATTNLNPFWWQTISKKVQGEACQRHGPILYSN